MIKLKTDSYDAAYALYRKNEFFFPLIAAVLLNEQDGVVYVDDDAAPTQAYVEHAFGFAQVFGTPSAPFEQALERYLLVDRAFGAAKVRLYGTTPPAFIADDRHASLRSWRQRFEIDARDFHHARDDAALAAASLSVTAAHAGNIDAIEQAFGVVQRFWRSPADFIDKSLATLVLHGGVPAAICYAAAVADQRAEIDVLTLPEYRSQGLGKLSVLEFMDRCFARSVRPLWDCFTNNAGSMMLCKSVGFVAPKAPYLFFTINR